MSARDRVCDFTTHNGARVVVEGFPEAPLVNIRIGSHSNRSILNVEEAEQLYDALADWLDIAEGRPA